MCLLTYVDDILITVSYKHAIDELLNTCTMILQSRIWEFEIVFLGYLGTQLYNWYSKKDKNNRGQTNWHSNGNLGPYNTY